MPQNHQITCIIPVSADADPAETHIAPESAPLTPRE